MDSVLILTNLEMSSQPDKTKSVIAIS